MSELKKQPRGWELSSTCIAMNMAGKAAGRRSALAETGAAALARVLLAQARQRPWSDLAAAAAVLDGLAKVRAVEALTALGETLLDAPQPDDWLAGVVVSTPAADDFPKPDAGEELDFESEKPYIEIISKMTPIAGGPQLIALMRMQKWYQPDIGADLYKTCTRIERQFKIRPMAAILLMWPSADGPAVTGSYRTQDKRGRSVDFRYTVRRAWEMPPEGAMAHPATMTLAPLTKGAKERLPEIIRVLRAQLAQIESDPKLVERISMAFYLSLGTICSLEEAHALLGDFLAEIQALPGYKKTLNNAFREGYAEALPEGPLAALRELVKRQARRRFNDDPAIAAVDGWRDVHALEAIAKRLPTAATWAELVQAGE